MRTFRLASLVLFALATVARADAKPNIVLFFADDWGRDAGCYADPHRPSPSDVVRTPNVDRCAREGVLFRHAFYSCPQCTPSRGALVTGDYFWRCGSAANLQGGEWRGVDDPFAKLQRFPHLLADAGYHTARAFKTIQFTPTRGGDGPKGGEFRRYGTYLSKAADVADRAKRRQEVIDQTRTNVRKAMADAAGKPFFFVYGPMNTHRPYARGSGKALWGIEPDSLKGKLPAFLPDVPEVREDMADYLGEVQAVDLMIGVFLEELRAAGKLDDTLLVLTGDNGVPGFPHGKTQMYDLGTAAPLIVRWPGKVKPGRVVDDFVNLMDMAPTFLEAAGVKPPATDARSFLPQLLADRCGYVDANRDWVIFGRERHYTTARAGNLPYPSRAVRTKDLLYVRNFKPDRWPMGDPVNLTESSAPSVDALRTNTDVTFRDLDASPTKAWLVTHRNDPEAKRYYDWAFAKRPAEELYDLATDPDQVRNIADDPAFTRRKRELAERLERVMRGTHDPRLEDAFDRPPYVEANPAAGRPRGGNANPRRTAPANPPG